MLDIQLLPYDFSALKPVIGPDTLFFHHEKHYIGYIEKANSLLPAKWADKSLEEVICLARQMGKLDLFNQSAQAWNHEFFFSGLSLNSQDKKISSDLLFLIERDFGLVDSLQKALVDAAISLFGSGWVWLVLEKGRLDVQKTSNAETPCGVENVLPLWCLDVWEHAYYLDYQNRRQDYATEVVSHALNWRAVAERLSL